MTNYQPGDRVRFNETTLIDMPLVRVTIRAGEVQSVLSADDTRVKVMLGEAAVWVSQKFVTREG